MVRTERTVINEQTVITVQLPARRALILKTKLVKLLGPSLTKLFASDSLPSVPGKKGLARDIDAAALASAMSILVDRLEPDAFLSLILECLSGTKVEQGGSQLDITRDTFDIIFSGGLAFMYKVLWFAVKVNYSDFFDLEGIGSLLQTKAKTPTPSELTPE